MGFWPFRRRNSRRKSKSSATIAGADDDLRHAAMREKTANIGGLLGRERSIRPVKQQSRSSRSPSKLQKNPPRLRRYSFSPDRGDSLRVQRYDDLPSRPLAIMHKQTWNAAGMVTTAVPQSPVHQDPDWQRVPTLHKRKFESMPRRRSSKKRKEDHDREAEIKAMSAHVPQRSTTLNHPSGKLMKKNTLRARQSLARRQDNSDSDGSMPLVDSMTSSATTTSEKHNSYTLKGMFAPHPTIRYAENPRYFSPSGTLGARVKRSTSRKKLAERFEFPEATIKAHKRVDDLADDLTASDIRELMDRDKRRRENKRIKEQMHMEKQLARRAEKQKALVLEAERTGVVLPPNLERGVIGRAEMGSGIGASMASSMRRRFSNASSRRRGKQPPDLPAAIITSTNRPELPRHASAAPSEADSNVTHDAVIEEAQIARLSRASMSPPASPKGHLRGTSNISEILIAQNTPKEPDQSFPQEISRPSMESRRPPVSWTSFFRRNRQSSQQSIPTSFSNTSRDSTLSHRQLALQAEARRSSTNIPKRTMSRFREDLPDYPVSPPDSRMHSPEIETAPIKKGFIAMNGLNDAADGRRHDTPTSGYRNEIMQPFPSEAPMASGLLGDPSSPEPIGELSTSMASVDSEASWLSGHQNPGSRFRSRHHQPSAASLQRQYDQDIEKSEEAGIAEDDFFSRLTPGLDASFDKSHVRSESFGAPLASSDDDDGGTIINRPKTGESTWGAVTRHAIVVDRSRIQSREGLLTEFEGGNAEDAMSEDEIEPMSPVSRTSAENINRLFEVESPSKAQVARATSVSMGKGHARQVSTGSAKRLEMLRRRSGDFGRRSGEMGGLSE